jgi:hypothetical protein
MAKKSAITCTTRMDGFLLTRTRSTSRASGLSFPILKLSITKRCVSRRSIDGRRKGKRFGTGISGESASPQCPGAILRDEPSTLTSKKHNGTGFPTEFYGRDEAHIPVARTLASWHNTRARDDIFQAHRALRCGFGVKWDAAYNQTS